MRSAVLSLATLAFAAVSAMPASAMFFHKKRCGCPCGDYASFATCHKTVYDTVEVAETRKVTTYECVPTVEDRTVTFTRLVESHETRTREVCELVPVVKTRQVTVMVPHTEQRTELKTVCKKVPVVECRTVTKDCGHWEKQCVQVGCKTRKRGCCCETVPVFKSKKVWCPNLVTTTEHVTVCKTVSEQVPCTVSVVVCKPEVRTESYTECVPTKRMESYTVTVCKPVCETRVEKVTVMKQVAVCKDVVVKVCKLVPRTECCSVPAAPCCH